jgi:hypothetical protein
MPSPDAALGDGIGRSAANATTQFNRAAALCLRTTISFRVFRVFRG